MATITYTPTSVPFLYKRHQVFPVAPQAVKMWYAGFAYPYSAQSPKIINLPPWLEAVDTVFVDETDTVNFTLRVKASYALSLPAGLTTALIDVQYETNISGSWTISSTVNKLHLSVSIFVEETVLLSISPTTKVYPYVIGGSLPASQLFQITSESNWTISSNQSWVSFSVNNGVGTGSVIIGVDPTGLPVGNYDAIVTVQDAGFTRTAVITMAINEGDTDTSYLYLSNRNLQFVSELAKPNTKQFLITAETSHSWTATPSASWIVISAASGTSGLNEIIVTVDSVLLAVGNYSEYITIECNGIIKKVYVVLIVLNFLTEGLESEGLYFADDLNKLSVTNTNSNTFLVLDAITSTGTETIPYQLEAPYFKGKSEIVIGTETNNLLKSVIPTISFISRVKNSIKPINIGFNAYNENKTTEALSLIKQFTNLKFLTGKTPLIENKLCYIPETIYVTKNAVLSLSVLATVAPTQIIITGDVSAIISTSIAESLYVYNAIVNLADFELVTGNAITITFGSLAVNVVIKKEVPETTLIAFENEWREYEFFECTGFLTKTKEADKISTELQVEGTKQTKVVSIDIGENYSLNTGFIYSQNEVNWLSEILKAKRIFIYQNNQPIEITLENKFLQVYETRKNEHSYILNFKKAIV